MAERTNKKSIFAGIITLIFVLFTGFVFVTFLIEIRKGRSGEEDVTVESDYLVTINDDVYEHADLSGSNFRTMHKGDHMSVSFVIPESHVDDPVLSIYVDHSALKVYFNEELVFENGSKNSRMLGYGYHYVKLPDEYSGISVRLEYDVISGGGKTVIKKPVIMNSRDQLRSFIVDNSLYLIIDIAIIVICLTLVLISLLFFRLDESFRRLSFLGISFFFMGLWEMCNYDLISIFSDSLVFKGYLEYSSLYIGPFFLALYFYAEFFRKESNKLKYIYKAIMILQGIFTVSAFILHFTDILYLPDVLPVCHLLLLANIGMMLAVLVHQLAKKNNNHKSMIFGLIIIIAFGILDIARFNLLKYVFNFSGDYNASYLLIGFFVFLITLLIDFLLNQKRRLYKSARAEAMDKLAHVDMMTGLANRLRCEEVFDELRNSKNVYGLISMDINFLKRTNDEYGHQEGDKLLTDFSKLLLEVCEDTDYTAGRMGGDEFIIIVPKADKGKMLTLLRNLDDRRDVINKDRKPFPISYAYGFCLSNDEDIPGISHTGNKDTDVNSNADNVTTDGTASGSAEVDIVEEVYRISDERMYEHKKIVKEKMKLAGI